jgi:hypothetical protein
MITSDLPICTVSAWRCVAEAFDLEELRSQRLDLLLDGGADVEGGDDGAEAARGGDRLQPGHAGAQHEHLRRRDRARRGHEHREEARHLGRGDQHGQVARDRRLRGQRVHRLCARDARDRLHRERGGARGRDRLRAATVGQRGQEADQHRLALEVGHLVVLRGRDLGHHVGAPGARRVDQGGAGLLQRGVRDRGRLTGAALDQDVVTRAAELARDVGNHGHALLPRGRLLGDTDPHAARNRIRTPVRTELQQQGEQRAGAPGLDGQQR